MSFRFKSDSLLYCSILILFTFLFCFTSVGYAYVELDETFGTCGLVSTNFGTGSDNVNSLAIDSQGRLVAAGRCSNGSDKDFALARYKPDGTLDKGFGIGGIVSSDFGLGYDYGNSLAIDSQDRLVVVGSCFNGNFDSDFALARYTESGDLDATFGSGGIVSTDFGSGPNACYSIAIDSRGRLVVAGECSNGKDCDFALARYTERGDLDTSFGSGGMVSTDFGLGNDCGHSLAIDSQDRLVVAGYCDNGTDYDFALARYELDGTLDGTFGSGGMVCADFGSGYDYGNSLAIDSQGRLVVAGYSSNDSDYDFALVRYRQDGTLDTGFGSGGLVSTDFGSGGDLGFSLAIDSKGRLVVAGGSYNFATLNFALARYTDSGNLDATFGIDGMVNTDFGSGDDLGEALVIDSRDRLVVAGYCDNGIYYDFALARYTDEDNANDDDDESSGDNSGNGGGSGGCNISLLSGIALLLAIPVMLLSWKIK